MQSLGTLRVSQPSSLSTPARGGGMGDRSGPGPPTLPTEM